ncbi:hypothetical protein ASPVEDRAFT_87613 [Aspergillus versicolor CBS 583.65]|uniref:NAD(P)-binding domain-containing protein n=1 Tax=Aspergillus versicolor CBS 583.65 TaxID=1036611 RepID=A0A1L9PXW8_ASPVE|nr:uncharacterized protein ASPVEDRAFT_87613 [Aspergillus versicolor CBS 583.65]OJJ06305.1 hypothetical protein ASPVEDRAFT_87613 [Aspergillus versicolor CBS 583.65]
MASSKPTIAFFGATGGSTISCLAPALEAGYRCAALARTPSKLRDLLTQRGVQESTITANLTIISGTATELEPVKQTIQMGEPESGSGTADIIVSGIGGKLLFSNPLSPTLDNPTICQDAMRTIITAVDEVNSSSSGTGKRPLVIALSTTGISDVQRDLPIAMIPMYHWMLKVPHEDKKVMERVILDSAKDVLGGYVIVRPSLLTDGASVGDLSKIRVGVEKSPAVGYTISREDVGRWVFEYLVKDRESQYVGEVVTITI